MLEFKRAEEIFNEMLSATDFEDSTAVELWNEISLSALAYVGIRSMWVTLEREQKIAMDSRRTRSHNVFMSSLKAHDRYLSKQGSNKKWIDSLFKSDFDRKYVGDFAGYFIMFCSLKAR